MSRARTMYTGVGLALALAACNRSYLEGRVTDVRGQALPGVIVREAASAEDQDLTDALGHYRVPLRPATTQLEFSKSGYTSAELSVDPAARRGKTMPDAALWPLPQNPGVYIVKDQRFTETTWAVPRQIYLKDGTTPYGVELPKEIREVTREPYIVAYRMSRYNARLSRLMAGETQGSADAESVPVWVEDSAMAAALDPVDTPAGRLLRLHIGRPLDPGIYGVHWGALEGYTTLDTKVFLFRIPEPPAEPTKITEPQAETNAAPLAALTQPHQASENKATSKPEDKAAKKPAAPKPSEAEKKKKTAPPPALLEPSDAPAVAPPAKP